jgi:hypothetical protein
MSWDVTSDPPAAGAAAAGQGTPKDRPPLKVSAFADIVTANPDRTWLNRLLAAVSIEFDNSGPRRPPPR